MKDLLPRIESRRDEGTIWGEYPSVIRPWNMEPPARGLRTFKKHLLIRLGPKLRCRHAGLLHPAQLVAAEPPILDLLIPPVDRRSPFQQSRQVLVMIFRERGGAPSEAAARCVTLL